MTTKSTYKSLFDSYPKKFIGVFDRAMLCKLSIVLNYEHLSHNRRWFEEFNYNAETFEVTRKANSVAIHHTEPFLVLGRIYYGKFRNETRVHFLAMTLDRKYFLISDDEDFDIELLC